MEHNERSPLIVRQSNVALIKDNDSNPSTRLLQNFNNNQIPLSLTKDEILTIGNQPAWRRARIVLLVIFWSAMLAMFTGSIVILMNTPNCPVEIVNETDPVKSFNTSVQKAYGYIDISIIR